MSRGDGSNAWLGCTNSYKIWVIIERAGYELQQHSSSSSTMKHLGARNAKTTVELPNPQFRAPGAGEGQRPETHHDIG